MTPLDRTYARRSSSDACERGPLLAKSELALTWWGKGRQKPMRDDSDGYMWFFGGAALVMATLALLAAVALVIRAGDALGLLPAGLWAVVSVGLFAFGIRALRRARGRP
jgi:hypothetical protein